MPRYFLDLPEDSAPRRWDPHAGPRPERADTRYFGAAFVAMERALCDADLDVVLTWDVRRVPLEGDRVVAVVLGDEGGRIPHYAGRVRAIFKAYGTRPALGAGPLRDRSLTGLVDVVQYGVRWLRWLPGGAAHAGRRLRRQPVGHVTTIPLGTFNQLELRVVAMQERRTDIVFAGSVEHAGSLRHRLAPKTRARREMLAAVRELARQRPGLRLDLRLTEGFGASEASSPEAYSQAVMDARVCLAPRGTSVETFRVLEGLRAGCLVVTERLPSHPFYAGAPVLQLDRWRQLPALLEPILGDDAELGRRHDAARLWWRDRCSEEAVGRMMAEQLNHLAAGPPRS